MTPLLFDPARNDTSRLAALHHSAFDQAWDAATLRDLLAGPGVFAFHSQYGFVLARVAADECEILTLAVAPQARGRGVGRGLVKAAASHAQGRGARMLFLEVGVDNASALALYAGLGFARVGVREGYYQGRDAWIFKAELPLSRGAEFA